VEGQAALARPLLDGDARVRPGRSARSALRLEKIAHVELSLLNARSCNANPASRPASRSWSPPSRPASQAARSSADRIGSGGVRECGQRRCLEPRVSLGGPSGRRRAAVEVVDLGSAAGIGTGDARDERERGDASLMYAVPREPALQLSAHRSPRLSATARRRWSSSARRWRAGSRRSSRVSSRLHRRAAPVAPSLDPVATLRERVGDALEQVVRLADGRHVGVVRGEAPALVSEDGLFTEADVQAMRYP
jgi:hypothetical protein